MKPDKLKNLKRACIDNETEPEVPVKKKNKEKPEKENKGSDKHTPKKTKRKSRVLATSSLPSPKANINRSKLLEIVSDESSEDELEMLFLQLKKSGIKTIGSSKKSPQIESSSKKKIFRSDKSTPEPKKSKKKLEDEFNSVEKIKKAEKKVPELEKLPEDLILNYKRTPIKSVRLEWEETPKEEKSLTLSRRSVRKKSILTEEIIYEGEVTPVKKTPRTPNRKSSSVKKTEVEIKTPVTKIVQKQPTTPLEKARLSLHVSTVPECLPCREKEYKDILTFLENKLGDGIGGCMYISGVPGTGKTATVTQVIKHLQNESQNGKVPDFKFIEINGMRLANPRQAYVQIWQRLFEKNEKITPDRAQRLLDDWFSKSDRKNVKNTTVLLVDELDLICTKKQDVVYNLLDWPTRTHSRLVVLTIANTMDMPERLFKGRVTSRMGLTRLTFMPYTHKQLEEIISARLNGLNAFVTDAVRLVTRKVAAVSGDARRALDICRRATELPQSNETVKISHIEQAIREMTNSNIVRILRNCGEMEKLFLRSLSDVSVRSNVEEIDLREVIDQLMAICTLEGVSRPSIPNVLTVANRLKCCRLIFVSQGTGGVLQKLILNVTQDDIHYAWRT